MQSDPFDFPLHVCNGCLVANVAPCPFAARTHQSRQRLQPGAGRAGRLLHRERGAGLPAAGGGSSVSTRRGLAAIALLVPLACTTKGSDYPYLPPTGGGGRGGTGMVTPTGNVTVTITSPSDQDGRFGFDRRRPEGHRRHRRNGTDLIDTSSVKVVVTAAAGSTAAISIGQLVSTGGDTYAGTISLGNLPTGSYTLTVSAKSLAGGDRARCDHADGPGGTDPHRQLAGRGQVLQRQRLHPDPGRSGRQRADRDAGGEAA